MFFIYKIPSTIQSLFPRWKWTGNPGNKCIYLTFDDGPHPEITTWVMNQLAVYHAKATFFCVGENAMHHPQITAELQKQGHQLGNHTHNHLKGWQCSTAEYLKNVLLAEKHLPGKLFRPPYGRITTTQGKKLRENGFHIVMWSILSCDYDPKLNPQKSLRQLKQLSKPGSIVVFHDSEKAYQNLKNILPEYLRFLSEEGYNMVTL